MTAENMSVRAAWTMILSAAAILMITMGIRMSMGLFVDPLSRDVGMTVAEVSFAIAVSQLMWGVAQPVAGAAAERYSSWRVLLAGTLTTAAGLAMVPFVSGVWGLTFAIGILMAFGTGAASFSTLMGAVSQKLPAKMRGTASGVINAGGSFGQFSMSPLTQGIILAPALGWVTAMFTLAAASLASIPLARLLLGRKTAAAPAAAAGVSAAAAPDAGLKQTVRTALKNRSYLLVHAGFFTCGFHIAFLSTHLPGEVALCGLPPQVASWSLALIGASNVVGSLVLGWAVGHWRSKYLLFWMYGSRALLLVVYLLSPRTDLTFYLFAVGLGFTWLATVPPTAALVGKLFGVRYLATLFGLTLLSHQIGGFLGAYLGGLAVTAFGDYGWMWYADIALSALAALCHLPIREEKIRKTAAA